MEHSLVWLKKIDNKKSPVLFCIRALLMWAQVNKSAYHLARAEPEN
jgi:hypothetical protein